MTFATMSGSWRMPKEKKKYFIVEFRFPFEVKDQTDPVEAAKVAQRLFNDQYGFQPDLWKARAIEFTFEEGSYGAQREFFWSPTGMTVKDIAKNILPHNERAAKGEEDDANDIQSPE